MKKVSVWDRVTHITATELVAIENAIYTQIDYLKRAKSLDLQGKAELAALKRVLKKLGVER